MPIGAWFSQNWFNLITSLGVIASLLFTGAAVRTDAKARKLGNFLMITDSHREIWNSFRADPGLTRVLDDNANVHKKPVTSDEEAFVNLVILNLSNYFCALEDDMVVTLDGLRRDVAQFLSKPVVASVWERTKVLQNDDFVRFVESCRNWR